MKRIWFIEVEKKQLGPFSVGQLRNNPLVTPDTLAWKAGMERWLPIRRIPELAFQLFSDEEEPSTGKKNCADPIKNEGEELTIESDPNPFIWWIFLLLLLFAYLISALTQNFR